MKKFLGFAVAMIFAGCIGNGDSETTERLGETAQNVISANVGATFLLDSAHTTTITTSEMPWGWYGPASLKTHVNVTWSMPPTGCHPAATGSMTSANTGSWSPVLNKAGRIEGYAWSVEHDLSGFENHWHNEIACNGVTTAIGCADSRTVTYTLSVDGACLTAGGTCTTTGSVVLPAVKDANVMQTNCPMSCTASLGACISACQANCGCDDINGNDNGNDNDSNCHRCCECNCKDELHDDNPACPAPQWSCYVPKHHHPACL